METAAAILAITGSTMQAIGAIQQGTAAKNAGDFNAAILNQNAVTERQMAGEREEAQRRTARRVLGSQRAALAQSGIGLDGSAADVMQQSAANAELDALTTRYEGELRSRGMETQARLERYQGKAAKKASYFEAAGSILSGSGQAYGLTK